MNKDRGILTTRVTLTKTFLRIILLVLLLVGVNAGVAEASWQEIYLEDFSSDPGWITNNSSHFYHDDGASAYFMHILRAAEPYEYVRTPFVIGVDGTFKLEFDIKPTYFPWAGLLHLGFHQQSMRRDEPCLRGGLANPDEGRATYVEHYSLEGAQPGALEFSPTAWTLNEWTHAVLVYDEDASTIDFTTYLRDSGANWQTIHIEDVGTFFPSPMAYLGATSHMMHPYSGVYAEGYLDNVSVAVPETVIPTLSEWGVVAMTLLLMTAGTIVFARRRKPSLG